MIIDTPGQIELFVYRASGPYFVTNFRSDNKVNIFTLDGMLVSTPINYVSIALICGISKNEIEDSTDRRNDKKGPYRRQNPRHHEMGIIQIVTGKSNRL